MLFLFWGLLQTNAKVMDNGVDPENLGTGQWIYFLADATKGLGGNVPSVQDVPSLMKYYKEAGIDFLAIKAGTGAEEFPRDNPQFTPALVKEAQAVGLKIFGYTRSDGKDVPGEIALASKIYDMGADGFIIDAEAEWEPPTLAGGPEKAIQLCEGIKQKYPNKFLGHAPFPIISKHSLFPYKEFGYYCDAVMPQDYWKSIGVSPKRMVQWMNEEWHTWQNSLSGKWTNAIKPIAPIGHGWNLSAQKTVTYEEIMEFVAALNYDKNPITPGGYKGVSYWRTDLHTPEMWRGISQAKIGQPDTTPTSWLNRPELEQPTRAVRAAAFGQPLPPPTPTAVTDGFVLDENHPNVTLTGNWQLGANADQRYGENYQASKVVSVPATATAVYRPVFSMSGRYDIYIWYPSHALRSTRTPWVIFNGVETLTNLVNQTLNGGIWLQIAADIEFPAGTNGTVSVSNDTGETSDRYVVADAVRFVRKNTGNTSAEPTTSTTRASSSETPVVTARTNNPNEVILDDNDPSGVTFDGTWYAGKSKHGRFGDTHMCAHTKATATTATATYRPTLTQAGTYDIYIWYSPASNRSKKAPWVLTYGANTLSIEVDQTANTGRWHLIAANIPLAADTNTTVRVSNQTTDEKTSVIVADAVRFVRKNESQ